MLGGHNLTSSAIATRLGKRVAAPPDGDADSVMLSAREHIPKGYGGTAFRTEYWFRALKDFIFLRPIRRSTEHHVRGHVGVCAYALVLEAFISRRLADSPRKGRHRPSVAALP